MSNIEQYKNSISEKYIQDFKKELNFFEKIMLMPVSKKMEEILKSKKKIDVDNLWDLEDFWFWRKVLWVKIWDKWLFNKLTDKVFNFLKEKQEKIIKAEASGRLEELQNLVINWKLDDLENDVDNISQDNHTEQNNSSSENNDTEESKENKEDSKDKDWDSWQSSVNPKVAGIGTWVVGGASYYAWVRKLENIAWIRNAKEIPNWFDVVRTKKLMQDLSANLAEKAKSPKINRAMKASYEKSIKIFNESAWSLNDDVGKAFMQWQKLWSKLPESTLKSLWVSKKFTQILDVMPDEELAQIIWKNSDEIKQFFKVSKWLDISDDLAKQLKLAEHISDLRWMNSAFKHASKLSKLSKWFKWLWAIAVIWLWVDVRLYFETMKEVDAIKKINDIRWEIIHDKANMQLWIWIATLLAEAAIIIWVCAAWWSMGWPLWLAVWLIVWAISFATSVLVDELYYDKKDFYSQNRYDYINKERTTIKQSIVQLLESDRLWMHEKMKSNVQEEAIEKGKELSTMEDAWEALIYQEELFNWWYDNLQLFYYSWKSQEVYEKELLENEPDNYKVYLEEKEKMENVIKIRMEYIKNYIQKEKDTLEYKSMKEMITQSKWIEYVENVLANSKVYEYIKWEHEDAYIENYKDMVVEEYKSAFWEKLKSDYPDKFDILEKLSLENPVHFYEICVWVEHSASSLESGMLVDPENNSEKLFSDEEIEQIKPNIDFIKRYFEYRKLWRSMESGMKIWIDSRDILWDLDYRYIEQVLLDIDSINTRPLISEPEYIKNYFSSYENFTKRQNINLQVSDNTGQNILYSIAKEFHWYSWDNNHLDVINFYNAGNQDSTWIYYDNGWRINQDLDWTQKFAYIATWQIIPMIIAWLDIRFDFRDIDNENMTADQVYNRIIEWETWTKAMSAWQQQLLWKAEWLDSSIEAADGKIIEEFKKRTKSIIEREIWYRDQKEVYEKKLIDFVKSQCSDREWYVEIPYDLVIECKKAKIWDVENYLFKIENWEIVALSTWASVGQTLNFDKTKQDIKYESLTPLREELAPEEKAIIDKVWMAHNRLEDMRVLQSWWQSFFNTHRDELWIPIDLEKEMSNKWLERQKIERSLLYLSPISAKSYLKENWETYYTYFEDTYIWMMATISQFTRWDDLWNVDHMNKARSWIGKNIIEVKDNTITISDWVSLEDDEEYYLLKYTKEIKDKDTNKTAEQLLLATENDTQNDMTVEKQHEKWKWMVKQILIAVLEAETIVFDDNWKPSSIWCNVDYIDEDKALWKSWVTAALWWSIWTGLVIKDFATRKIRIEKSKTKMEEIIWIYLWYHPNVWVKKWLDDLDTYNIQTKEQNIRKVSESEKSSYETINDLTQKIIKTKDMVDWAGRRWNPNFLPDHNNIKEWYTPWLFESWWHSVKIHVYEKDGWKLLNWRKYTYVKIEWLDLEFNLEEWFRMANHINWTKDYIGRNPNNKWNFFYWSRSWTLFANDATWKSAWLNDTDILASDTIKKYYPKMLEDSNKNKILSYLNSL
jgi:nitrate reductase NapAB chaperone NapD